MYQDIVTLHFIWKVTVGCEKICKRFAIMTAFES
jgi:hypothetical protein